MFFCLHGAGLSALSFAAFAKQMKDECTVVAFDWRGHGRNAQEEPNELSEENLLNDSERVLKFLTSEIDEFKERSILIMGHSMGGAIASKLTTRIMEGEDEEYKHRIKAYFVIDVVEGSALDVLPMMEQIVKQRPPTFDSLEDVVKWGYMNHESRFLESARVSMPDRVRQNEEGKYEWKVDLLESKQYWRDWFIGLSDSFIKGSIPKMLILAAADRMDRELTIAQM